MTIADITRQKQAEADLILKNQELEKLIVQKDNFFSIIAHDLRGPFNGFLGLTKIIAQELRSLELDEIQAIGDSMWHSATNLFKLLENLLQWSQMEQGLIPYNPSVSSLLSFAEESLTSEFQTAENKEIDIVFDIPYDILKLICSRIHAEPEKHRPGILQKMILLYKKQAPMMRCENPNFQQKGSSLFVL